MGVGGEGGRGERREHIIAIKLKRTKVLLIIIKGKKSTII
jgi:hypothetical protein